MEDIHDILRIRTNDIKPEKGRILISEPFLYDYFFKRSVILLADHNDEGSFGVIINKPVSAPFNEVVRDFPEFDARIFLGGPVQGDSLFFLHTLGEQIEGSIPIMEGIYWGGDIENVRELISMNLLDRDNIRFFIGYSGWAPQQLDGELKRNSWVVSHINKEQLLHTQPSVMWSQYLQHLGEEYSFWTNYPDDPTDN
jgi:putative transcriptional regulator